MGESRDIMVGGVPDERILRFIRRHHVLSVATISEKGPWCAALFYAYSPELGAFVFTTDPATRHGSEMLQEGSVAASVVLETRVVGNVQGLQISGRAERAAGEEMELARGCYLKRFPYAVVADLHLWLLRPTLLKLTDNKLGFGRKLIWRAAEDEE